MTTTFAAARLSEEEFSQYKSAEEWNAGGSSHTSTARSGKVQFVKVVGYNDDVKEALRNASSEAIETDCDYVMVPFSGVDSVVCCQFEHGHWRRKWHVPFEKLWIMQRLESVLKIPVSLWVSV
jgi:hypothetical protein